MNRYLRDGIIILLGLIACSVVALVWQDALTFRTTKLGIFIGFLWGLGTIWGTVIGADWLLPKAK